MNNSKLIFIVNPAAKNGLSMRIWSKLSKKLAHISYELYFTKDKGDGTRLAKAVVTSEANPVVIVAVGGDGTIHEVANGVIPYSHVTLAYIPAGSGNDFARGYRLPLNPERCITLIADLMNQSVISFDSGLYKLGNNKSGYFINSLGAGFDAVISMRVNESKVKKWLNQLSLGKLIYVFYLLLELFRYQPSTLQLIVDGVRKSYEKTWFVTISNQPYYGGGMQIAPQADPKDEQLDVVVVHHVSRLKLLLVFLSVFWGGHIKFKTVESFNAKTISIQYSEPTTVHADGEIIGKTPLFIKIVPKSWRLIQNQANNSNEKLRQGEYFSRNTSIKRNHA